MVMAVVYMWMIISYFKVPFNFFYKSMDGRLSIDRFCLSGAWKHIRGSEELTGSWLERYATRTSTEALLPYGWWRGIHKSRFFLCSVLFGSISLFFFCRLIVVDCYGPFIDNEDSTTVGRFWCRRGLGEFCTIFMVLPVMFFLWFPRPVCVCVFMLLLHRDVLNFVWFLVVWIIFSCLSINTLADRCL